VVTRVDSYKDHLKFGLMFEVPFVILMVIFNKWYFFMDYSSINTYYYLLYFTFILFISPMLMDIDHRAGKVREWTVTAGLLLIIIGLYNKNVMFFGLLFACTGQFIIYITKHRGIVHSWLFCICVSFGVYYIVSIELAVLCLIGNYTHLVADKIAFKIY